MLLATVREYEVLLDSETEKNWAPDPPLHQCRDHLRQETTFLSLSFLICKCEPYRVILRIKCASVHRFPQTAPQIWIMMTAMMPGCMPSF